jgi:peptidoglycan/LPS O-acetylase OafA/YrhL
VVCGNRRAKFFEDLLLPAGIPFRSLNGATLAKEQSYRPDIDGLRAIAILSVVAYHADRRWAPGGFIGVDVFFVISGYLITQIILRSLTSGSFSLVDFYRRRIRRIMPALIVILLATWLIGWFKLMPAEYESLGWHISAASVFASNFLLIHETGYFDTAAEFKPLLHLWSLAVEEQFYLIWPVTLLVLWKCRANTILLLSTFGALSFGLTVANVDSQILFNFFSPLSRAWELTIGALLASSHFESNAAIQEILNRPVFTQSAPASQLRNRDIVASVGLTSIALSIGWINPSAHYPNWSAVIPALGTALLIAVGANTWIDRGILSRPIVVGVGLISYPLYLWHWPLLSFARIARVGEPPLLIKLSAIALAVVLATLTYLLVERPIRFGGHSRPLIPAAVVVLLCMVGTLGLATQWNRGFLSRLPEAVREIAAYHYDFGAAQRVGDCLLNLEQDERQFGADCVDREAVPGGEPPLVFLWGDSHAGHLYPGFRRLEGTFTFSLAQLTKAACPPILDLDFKKFPTCRGVNDFVIGRISELRPKIVVLAASWFAYPDEFSAADLVKLIERSINRLKQIGVDQIVLVGPVPVYNPSLPKALMSFYWATKPAQLPARMAFGLTRFNDFDDSLAKAAAESGIVFVSPTHVLCNSDGCLTMVGGDPKQLTAWDSAHLTDAGSSYLVEHIASKIKWN